MRDFSSLPRPLHEAAMARAAASVGLDPIEDGLPLGQVFLDPRGRKIEQRQPVRGGLHIGLGVAQVGEHRQLVLFKETFELASGAGTP